MTLTPDVVVWIAKNLITPIIELLINGGFAPKETIVKILDEHPRLKEIEDKWREDLNKEFGE